MGLKLGGIGRFLVRHKAKIGAIVAAGGSFLAGAMGGREAIEAVVKILTGG